MTRTLVILRALAPAGVAHAQDVTLKPLGEARLRYENGLAADADALTQRLHGAATRPLVADPENIALARASRSYGDEIDLLASAKRGKCTASARHANYDADGFGADTHKFWLQLDWTL